MGTRGRAHLVQALLWSSARVAGDPGGNLAVAIGILRFDNELALAPEHLGPRLHLAASGSRRDRLSACSQLPALPHALATEPLAGRPCRLARGPVEQITGGGGALAGPSTRGLVDPRRSRYCYKEVTGTVPEFFFKRRCYGKSFVWYYSTISDSTISEVS